MRVQKSKTVFFSIILNMLVLIPIHYSYSSELVQWTSITDTATFEATKRFGDQSTVHFLRTFYDIKGRPAVYLFLVAKNREEIPGNFYIYQKPRLEIYQLQLGYSDNPHKSLASVLMQGFVLL